jgi:hypothetical protein
VSSPESASLVTAAAPQHEAPVAAPPPDAAPAPVTDPKVLLAEVELLIQRGAWSDVAARLGPLERAATLPPLLGLVYAVAAIEAAGEAGSSGAAPFGVRCAAAAFGLAHDNPIAIVIAKRLLRRNPAAWKVKPAPPAWVSGLIMAAAVIVGTAVGLFLNRH